MKIVYFYCAIRAASLPGGNLWSYLWCCLRSGLFCTIPVAAHTVFVQARETLRKKSSNQEAEATGSCNNSALTSVRCQMSVDSFCLYLGFNKKSITSTPPAIVVANCSI